MNIGKYVELYSEDLRVKNYSPNTIKNYCSQIYLFLNHFENIATKPSEISEKNIKEWLLLANTINGRKHRLSAVKLFYRYTGKQPLKLRHIEYPKSERKLPRVIDHNFLVDTIGKIKNVKHKTIIMLAYSTGMRVSEICQLPIVAIDSKRMIIMVNNGKGRKDRIVPLSVNVLNTLREYYKLYKPKYFLFEGQKGGMYTAKSCNAIVKKYLGGDKHFHLLRHSSFTAMLDNGTDLRKIQSVAGHSNINTTTIYTHLSLNSIRSVGVPI
jgi:integrase/recombinase XerD